MTLDQQIRLVERSEELLTENDSLREELLSIRPLARLAHMMSLMEGENQRLFKDLGQSEQDWEYLTKRVQKLELRIDALESKRNTTPPPGGGGHP